MNCRSGGTSILPACSWLRALSELSNRFGSRSAIATSFTGPSGDSKALTAAPLPRMPQPINANRMVLFSAA
jgi:hypothetical protein